MLETINHNVDVHPLNNSQWPNVNPSELQWLVSSKVPGK